MFNTETVEHWAPAGGWDAGCWTPAAGWDAGWWLPAVASRTGSSQRADDLPAQSDHPWSI